MRKNDTTNFHKKDLIRLLKNGFAFCFEGARLSTSIGSDIEHGGHVSTVKKVISNKYGDNSNEKHTPILSRITNFPPQIRSSPHQKVLIHNHIDANKGKSKRYL